MNTAPTRPVALPLAAWLLGAGLLAAFSAVPGWLPLVLWVAGGALGVGVAVAAIARLLR